MREQDKAAPDRQKRDHLKLNSLLGSRLSGWLTGVARIGKADFDRAVSQILNLFGQLSHLFTVGRIGWCHIQRQQVTQCIDRQMHRAPLPFTPTT